MPSIVRPVEDFDIAEVLAFFPSELKKIRSGVELVDTSRKCDEFAPDLRNLEKIIKNLAQSNEVRHADFGTADVTGDYFETLMPCPGSDGLKLGIAFERFKTGDYGIWFTMGDINGIPNKYGLRKKDNLGHLYWDNTTKMPRLVQFYEDMTPYVYRFLQELFRTKGKIDFSMIS